MSEITINYPVTRSFDELDAFSQTFDINDPLSAQFGSDTLNEITDFRDEAEEHLLRMAKPIKEALSEVRGYWVPMIDRAEVARKRLADKLARYHDKVKRERLALELKARAEARQEQERLTREAAAREAEGHENALKLRAEALAQAQAGNQTSAAELARRADQAEMGAQQDAQTLIDQAQQTIAFPVEEQPKVEGITAREMWTYRLVDLEAVIGAACPKCHPDGKARGLLTLNTRAVQARVTAQKDAFDVPGIIAEPKTVIAATG